MHPSQIVGRWIAVIVVCACLGSFTACAPQGGGAGEGSSAPPSASDSGNYVFPPPNLQVYD